MTAPVVAVIGAGSTGRRAALAAVEYGLDVHLFDRFPIDLQPLERLTLHHSTPVWGLFPGPTVVATHGDMPHMIDADAVLLANGGIDRVVSFPGSTLPGVMASTGLLNLINRWNLLPGQRFTIIGDGLIPFHAASVISKAGGTVARVFPNADAWSLEVLGSTHVTGVRLNGEDTDCDIVVLALGLLPDLSLAAMAECELFFDEPSQQWHIRRDDRLRTSSHRIWAAGQAAGTSMPAVASAEGPFAAASIAAELGTIDVDTLDRARQHFLKVGSLPASAPDEAPQYCQPWSPHRPTPTSESNTLQTSDPALRTPIPGPRSTPYGLRPTSFICRCEEVTAAQIDAAIAAGSTTLNDLKRRTRAGMGLCQGAYCLPQMASILNTSLDLPLSAIAPMTMRPPTGGVSLAALAEASRVRGPKS